MSARVNITVKSKAIKLPVGAKLIIRKACNATLKYEEFIDNAEVEVSIVTDQMIKEINSEFRNIDNSTDVLSFPLGEDGVYDKNPETDNLMLGDIVISIDHAIAQADLYGHSFEREIAFLTVHSMLHLLGYDHVNGPLEEREMFDKQEEILEALGLAIIKV